MKLYLDDDTASALLAKLLKCERAADPLLVLRVEDNPAGRSSRAAYQTCRAGASFGRAIGPTRDDGLDFAPWHAPQENHLWIPAKQGTRRTEADIVVAVGRADVRRLIVERAAAL